jgi:hypothetical protein
VIDLTDSADEKLLESDSDNNDKDDILIEKLSHQDKLGSIFALARVKRYLMPLVEGGKLSLFEARLIKSFIQKKDLINFGVKDGDPNQKANPKID